MADIYGISKDLGMVTAYAYAVSKGYTGTEEEFATLMASYATVGQQAVDAALEAQTSASMASQSAATATSAKDAAQAASNTASTAATNAHNSEAIVEEYAMDAWISSKNAASYSSTASGAADVATQKAESVSESLTVATESASSAANSAASALSAKNDAVSAKDDAVTAKNDAVSAKDAAEAAAEDAESVVMVQPTQPTASGNIVWYDSDADNEVVVPTMDEFNQLSDEIVELKGVLNISNPVFTLTSGNYINYNGGISSGSSFSYSSAVAVKKGDLVRLIATGYSTTVSMISRCDQSGNVLGVLVLSDGNSEKTYEYFCIDDGYVCFCFKHTEPHDVTIIGNPYLGECTARQILTKNLPVKFRIGNITITYSGWSYSNSTTRVSTAEGYTIHLRPGDIVGLTSYNGYRYFLGWKKSDGTYGAKGWNTADYVVIDEGDYVVNITAVPEATVSDVSDLANLFKYTIAEDANTIFKYIGDNDAALDAKIDENTSAGLQNPLLIPQKARFAMHRGLSSEAPENTVPAFELAGQNQAWAIETDIYETTDGEFVCFHDDTVDRMTDGTGNIAEMTYTQVQALTIDAGNNIDRYPNLKIPKMITYLQICKKYGCVAFIEVKTVTNYNNMIALIKNFGMEKSCVFLVGTEGKINSIRAYSSAPVAFLGYQASDASSIISMLENHENCWADFYATTVADSVYVYLAHSKNIPVVIWTIDSASSAEDYFGYGVDVITSNTITKLE